MRAAKTGWTLLAATLLAAPALGQSPAAPSAEQIAAIRAHNQEIVARTPQTTGVFSVGDDGTIKHLQSGLICPASFPNATLSQALIFQSTEKGSDVGCDYKRADELGGAYAKLTIFATKAAPGTTLDSAFAGFQREVAQVFKDAQVLGPAITIVDKGGQVPDFRSEEYLVTMNQRAYTSDLVVAISAGWVVEIRATYVGRPREIQVAKDESIDAATIAIADRVMSSTAFVDAMSTVGK